MHDFSYIDNESLRVNFENAFSYVMYLTEHIPEEDTLRAEHYRTIIVYIVSIIEAFLAYFYIRHKTEEDYIGKEEYKHLANLPKDLTYKEEGQIVLAKKINRELEEKEIAVSQYVDFFLNSHMKEDTGRRIKKLSKIRNTVHLGAERVDSCDERLLEEAVKLLTLVLTKGKNRLLA
jgi:hypothetical protein